MLDLHKMLFETFLSPLHPFSYNVILLAIISLLFLYRRRCSTTSISVPPSPLKLPIIGNLYQLSVRPHRALQTLSQRHGDLMLLYFGSVPVLVVSSAAVARQMFTTHDIFVSDRLVMTFFRKLCYNFTDVASAPYGEYWRQLRSICVLNLLSNKMVRSFRKLREAETKSLIANINKYTSSSISSSSSSPSSSPPVLNLSEMMLTLIKNVLTTVCLGRKYTYGEDGKTSQELLMTVTELFKYICVGDFIPWLSWLDYKLNNKLDDLARRFDELLEKVIEEHMKCSNTGDDGMESNQDHEDFVRVLLRIQEEDSVGFPIDRVTIKAIVMDMLVGGSDTTFASLEWMMSEVIRNPKVMKKLKNEIRGIVGNRTDIIEDDLVGMHYLRAVIKETLRLHPPATLLFPRILSNDVKINGYDIKAHTQVIVNAWQIGREEGSYNNPLVFDPERFLNISTDYKGIDFKSIPFGAGRRGCPGVEFASAVQEIALANIVHNFSWALPNGARVED